MAIERTPHNAATKGARARLGERIRAARRNAGLSQPDLAEIVGKRKQLISSAELGRHIPPFELLVRLHATLRTGERPRDDEHRSSLAEWIVNWLEAHQEAKGPALTPDQRADVAGALDQLGRSLRPPRRPAVQPYLSLADFPSAFEPLTIITGDRRETSEDRLSLADLFAYSVAITDVTFLPLLQGMQPPPKIRSDKLAVVMDPEFLEKEFGSSNLLIIGSPGVNWAARLINRRSLFRFDIDPEWVEWDENLRARHELRDEQTLRWFSRVVDLAQESRGEVDDNAVQQRLRDAPVDEARRIAELARGILAGIPPKNIMNSFRKTGILDPADGLIHGEVTRDNNDFAVVSLAPNPFDRMNRHVSILVAGIHGPGTTHALRTLLENPQFFGDRPFGGVLQVTLPSRFTDWSTRFQSATPDWQTEPYDPPKLKALLDHARKQPPKQQRQALRRYEDGEIQACSAFISRLMTWRTE